MSDCVHPDFQASVSVNRLADADRPMRFFADVQVSCAACGLPFRFIGLDAGISFGRPMVSIDAIELRAPIEPNEHPVLARSAVVEMERDS